METISTKYGDFTPQNTTNDLRRKEILPVEYHDGGALKSLPLEEQTLVATPAGDVPAELVTFHDNGELNRIFPLNGRLSGYWSQEDEAALAEATQVNTPVGPVNAILISACFFDTGAMRSLTLWPGEAVCLETPVGVVETRIGISFTPEGAIRSVEPAKPTIVETPVGDFQAFDPDAVGVNGDANSLAFHPDGTVARVVSTLTKLTVVSPEGKTTVFVPDTRESLCGDTETEVVPMTVEFDDDAVRIRLDPEGAAVSVPWAEHAFFTEPYLLQLDNPFTGLKCSM